MSGWSTQALRRSEERTLRFAQIASDWFWETDAQHRLTFLSERLPALMGRSAASLLGEPLAGLFVSEPEDNEVPNADRAPPPADLLAQQAEIKDAEVRLRTAENRVCRLSLFAHPTFAVDGRFTGHIGTGTDVTPRKRRELELRGALFEAEKANRAKGAFLAMMSYEIRTPLNGVLGMTNLLAATELSRTQYNYIQAISDSGESLLRVLNDILDYSKIQAGRLDIQNSPFDVMDCFRRVVRLMAPKAEEKGIKRLEEYDPALPTPLLGDALRVKQIVLNLISNAIKFTEQGQITVMARAVTREGGLCVEIAMQDTGIGISANKLDTLFVEFEQVDDRLSRRFEGTGLGLAICKNLVQLMGGTIGVTSAPELGSTFMCCIPFKPVLNDRTPSTTTAPSDSLPVRRPSTWAILVVDDNPIPRTVTGAMLRKGDHTVGTANGEADAMTKLAERTWDIVLMDLRLGGVSGLDVTKRTLATSDPSQLPSIFGFTADYKAAEKAACLAGGMTDVSTKPLTAEKLADVLTKADSRRAGGRSRK